ncbi:MAG: cobalt-zinc-cadmium efflux system membrane fusion protein [Bradyrhizobium sp.]|jgi:cobalt-zinc-cadmium efflux system membrane fusion protein
MTVNLNKKQGIAILMVLAIGALLAFLILGLNSSAVSADTHGTDSHAEAGGHDDDKAHAEEGHEEPDHEEASVTMSEQQMKQNGVELGTAGPARLNSTLQLIGAIHVNEDRMVHIVPRLSGIVESVSANAGDTVRKGQVLAVISSHALADQRSESIAAQQRLALARTTFAHEKSLWEEKISAEQDYLQARNALQEADIAAQSARQKLAALGANASTTVNLTRYEIRSPINGTVTDKRIAIGASLKDDTTIFIVADLSTVWADIVVPAKDLNAVSTGQQATVEAIAFAHEATGTLSYVGAVVGTQTRTASARIVLPNPKGVWRPGLPVTVRLVSASVDVAIAVPVTAIQTMNDAPTVFGRHGDSFEARPLTLGRSDGMFTEVLEGLRAGEQVAVRNSFLIKADLGKSGASHAH